MEAAAVRFRPFASAHVAGRELTMFYRASDPSMSTRDWFALNVSAIPASLIFREDTLADDIENERISEILPPGPSAPAWNVEPDEADNEQGVTLYAEPDPDAYDGAEDDPDYVADLAAWRAYEAAAREEIDTRERDFIPMWGTVWVPEDDSESLRAALAACGLRMYEHDDAGLVIGADSAGHSFFGAYWIPLRARLVMANEHISSVDREAIFAVLRAEAKDQGEARALDSIIGEAAK